MITIFHLDNSRSERIVWLVEELGLVYELRSFGRENRAAPAALLDIHLLGTAPLLRDGSQVVMESGAIVEYLINRHGRGHLAEPVSSPYYIQYLQWLHFAEGSAMSAMSRNFSLRMLLGDDAPAVRTGALRQQRVLDFIDRELNTRPYFAGPHFTAADIMMEYYFAALQRSSSEHLSGYRGIATWIDLVRSRPAYRRMTAIAAPKVLLN